MLLGEVAVLRRANGLTEGVTSERTPKRKTGRSRINTCRKNRQREQAWQDWETAKKPEDLTGGVEQVESGLEGPEGQGRSWRALEAVGRIWALTQIGSHMGFELRRTMK